MAQDNQGPGTSPPASPPPLWLPPGTLLYQTYRIGSVLGQGGFGITYRAFDERLGQPVAVKEFFLSGSGRLGLAVQPPSSLAPEMVHHTLQRFLDEARSLARFNHPGIVRVLSSFEENGTGYIVMEFLQGETLEVWLGRVGRLSESQVVRVAHSVGDALSEMHRAGLLHQDVKPANIMSIPSGRLVLVDFGAARQHATTRAYTVLLTPGYAPPEQYSATGQRGPYSDVYSLGATLYQLVTGTRPPTPPDRAIGQAELLPVRRSQPEISQELDDAIQWALTMDKKARPQTVEEFLQRLPLPASQPSSPGGSRGGASGGLPPSLPTVAPGAAAGPPPSWPPAAPGAGSWPPSASHPPIQAAPPPSWHPSGGSPQVPAPPSWLPSGGAPPAQAPPPASWLPSGGAPPAQAPPPASWIPSGGAPPAQAPPPASWPPSGGAPPAQAPPQASWPPSGGAPPPGWTPQSPPPLAPTIRFDPPPGGGIPPWAMATPATATSRGPSRMALAVAAFVGILLVAVGLIYGRGEAPRPSPSGSASAVSSASPSPIAGVTSPTSPRASPSGTAVSVAPSPPPGLPHAPSPSPAALVSAQLAREFRCQGEINSVDWMPPPNALVLAASDDRSVRGWNVDTGAQSWKLPGLTLRVSSLAISPDGKIVATVTSDSCLRFFNRWENRQTMLSIPIMNAQATDVLAFSRSGFFVGALTKRQTLMVGAVRARRILRQLKGPAHLTAFAFSPDDSMVALSGKPPVVVLFNTRSGRVLKRLVGHRDVVQALDFSPRGRFLASVSEDGSVRLWDVVTGVSSTLPLGERGFTLRFSPDGKLLAAGCRDGVVRVFRIDGCAGSLVLQLKGAGIVKSVSFRRGDSSWLAAGFSDGKLRVWRLSGLR